MAYKIALRTALAVFSVTTAALLITEGPASAAGLSAGDGSAVITRSAQPAHAHDRPPYGIRGESRDHDHGRPDESDDARHAWILGQVSWMRDHQAERGLH